MKKRFRVFSALCCLLLAVSALSGCGGGGAGRKLLRRERQHGQGLRRPSAGQRLGRGRSGKIGFEKRELENPNVKLFLPYEPTDAAKGQIAKYEEKYGGKVDVITCSWTCGLPAWPS